MTKLPVKVANELSCLLNQMLACMAALERAKERNNQEDIDFWYHYQLKAERGLQEMGIHLAAPLE